MCVCMYIYDVASGRAGHRFHESRVLVGHILYIIYTAAWQGPGSVTSCGRFPYRVLKYKKSPSTLRQLDAWLFVVFESLQPCIWLGIGKRRAKKNHKVQSVNRKQGKSWPDLRLKGLFSFQLCLNAIPSIYAMIFISIFMSSGDPDDAFGDDSTLLICGIVDIYLNTKC